MLKKLLLYFALLLWLVVPLGAQPTFTVSNVNSTPNQVANVDIKVSDFTDIVSFQFSINWDPNLLQFIGTNNYEIESFTSNNVGASQENITDGKLIISWLDNTLSGISVLNDEVLFSIQYVVLGDNTADSEISITNNPAVIEVVNSELTDIGMIINNGLVSIQGLDSTKEIITSDFTVSTNYPNPFSKETQINFTLTEANTITLTIMNSTGKVISTQSNFFQQGEQSIILGRDLFPATGAYTYRFETPNVSINRKLIFIK